MKKMQNNFTTPEQSKRLLELGLPADSADCGIVEDIMHGGIEILRVPYSEWCKGYENISLPCWSVGRLIEIWLHICDEGFEVYRSCNLVDILINEFEEYDTDLCAEFGKHIDFSKLV